MGEVISLVDYRLRRVSFSVSLVTVLIGKFEIEPLLLCRLALAEATLFAELL